MQVILIARPLESQVRRAFEDARALSITSITTLDGAQARRAIDEGPPDLVVVECDGAGSIELIKELRAASVSLPIIAIAGEIAPEEASWAGADDVLTPAELDHRALARAVRYAFLHRDTQRAELRLLESMQLFGEWLALDEELDVVVDHVLDQMIERTSAEIGLLVCNLEWRGVSDRVVALRGAHVDIGDALDSLPEHPLLSPLHTRPGIGALEPGAVGDRFKALGAITSTMTVPVARSGTWGRGGVLLGSSKVNAFTEPDLQIATAIAAWAGVAILHAGALRERDRAIEVRERVLAVASHDLRTPLSVLNMVIELLGETDSADERVALVPRGQRAVGTMQRLIGDLLDYAAVDAGKLRIEIAPTTAQTIARRSYAAVAPSAAKARIELRCSVDDCELSLHVDGGRIEQALTNILDNAVKFTESPGGRVELRVGGDGVNAWFSVTDNGPGIPEDKQRRLFDRFYTSSKRGSGVGLGLSIARGIVERHGGSLLVESTPGQGSTFVITLPRAANLEGLHD